MIIGTLTNMDVDNSSMIFIFNIDVVPRILIVPRKSAKHVQTEMRRTIVDIKSIMTFTL